MAPRLFRKSLLVVPAIYLLFQLVYTSNHHDTDSCYNHHRDFTKSFADAEKFFAAAGFRHFPFVAAPLFDITVPFVSDSPSVATYVAPLRSRAPPA
jgi:hypothetical protein